MWTMTRALLLLGVLLHLLIPPAYGIQAICNIKRAFTGCTYDTNCNCVCGPGRYNDGDICVACAPGTYSAYSDRFACSPCQRGYYQNEEGQISCKSCDAGFYQDETGQSSCKPCREGTYSPRSGCASCLPCLSGLYQDETGQASCKSCSAGTYQNQAGQLSCKPCGQGFYSTEASLSSQSQCEQCGAGYYQDEDVASSCKMCAAGKYQSQSASSSCTPCAAGSHQDQSGQGTCDLCLAGYFQDQLGQHTCKPCSAGSYQQQPGQASCQLCSEGTYSSEGGRSAPCVPCSVGSYQNLKGQSSCKLCRAGTYQTQPGRTSCETCPEHEYQDQDGQASCKQCEDGEIVINNACASCAIGTYASNGACVACSLCPIGYTVISPCTSSKDTTCQDKTPPIIYLFRPESMQAIINIYAVAVSTTSSFPLPIVVANDTAPGAVVLTSPRQSDIAAIDISVPSTHQRLTYVATDANGLTTTRVLRITVVDAAPPVIQFEPEVLQLEAGRSFDRSNLTSGVSVVDDIDGELETTSLVMNTTNLNTHVLGTYSIHYRSTSTDSAGNVPQSRTRTVLVQDTLAPVVIVDFGTRAVLPGNIVQQEAATFFSYPRVSASDTFDETVTAASVQLSEIPSRVDTNSSDGTQFILEYSAQDASNNTAIVKYTILMRDTTPPVVQLLGPTHILHVVGTLFGDPGASAIDSLDGQLEVQVSGNVNVSAINAEFPLVYTACDAAGNCASIQRLVTIVPLDIPVLVLNGALHMTLANGQPWVDPGIARADDPSDGDLSQKVAVSVMLQRTGQTVPFACAKTPMADLLPPAHFHRISSMPHTSHVDSAASAGTIFRIEYRVADTEGNVATAERFVEILDTEPPVIRGNDEVVHTLEYGEVTTPHAVAKQVLQDITAYDSHDGDMTSLQCISVEHVGPSPKLKGASVQDIANAAITIHHGDVTELDASTIDGITSNAAVGTVFVLTISVQDRAGHTAAPFERALVVVDTTSPMLVLLGSEHVLIPYGTAYVEPGYAATDLADGNLTLAVVVTGASAIDMFTPNEYSVKYSVVDKSGNRAVLTRRVTVQPLVPPEEDDAVLVLELSGLLEGDVHDYQRVLERKLREILPSRPFVIILTIQETMNETLLVELACRDAQTLQWVPASQIQAQLQDVTLVETFTIVAMQIGRPSPADSLDDTHQSGQAESASASPAVAGAISGLVLIALVVGFTLLRRKRQKTTIVLPDNGIVNMEINPIYHGHQIGIVQLNGMEANPLYESITAAPSKDASSA
eukprot:m.109940 g.109940  ORF g.109940 m.109940 type:complete len:1268 (+) comp15256_c0_seq2:79-3882(+)